MIDYEELILIRQDYQEIYEDDPDIYEALLNGDFFLMGDDEINVDILG